MKNRIRLISFLSIIIGFFSNVNAQTEATLSFMDNVYQSTYYSPFNRSDFKVSVGLPAISSVYFGLKHSAFSVADFYPNGLDVAIDPDVVLSELKDVEYLQTSTNVDLFHIFMQRGDHGLSFNVTEKVSARVGYASALFRLAWEGNGDFVGEDIDLSGTGVDIQHYREYALGYYRKLDKWQFSGKAKLLFGKSSFKTNTSDLTVSVDDDVYQHNGNGDYSVNVGGFDFDRFDDDLEDNETLIRDYLTNGANRGFALDLGASYDYSEKLQLNAALTNVGFINWKESAYKVDLQEEAFINGYDLINFIYDDNDEDETDIEEEDYLVSSYPDSLVLDSTSESYRTSTPWNFAVGGRYNFYKGTYAVGRMNFNHYKRLQGQFTLGVYHDLYRWFNIGVTNTIENGRVFNPGLGLVLKGGPVQFYMATDALRAIGFLRAKQVNLRFGINLVFGHMKDQEKITSVVD